jgi:hypothetical protein
MAGLGRKPVDSKPAPSLSLLFLLLKPPQGALGNSLGRKPVGVRAAPPSSSFFFFFFF